MTTRRANSPPVPQGSANDAKRWPWINDVALTGLHIDSRPRWAASGTCSQRRPDSVTHQESDFAG